MKKLLLILLCLPLVYSCEYVEEIVYGSHKFEYNKEGNISLRNTSDSEIYQFTFEVHTEDVRADNSETSQKFLTLNPGEKIVVGALTRPSEDIIIAIEDKKKKRELIAIFKNKNGKIITKKTYKVVGKVNKSTND